MKRPSSKRILALCGLGVLIVGLCAEWTGRQIQQARLDRNLGQAIQTNAPQQVKFWLDAGANPNWEYPLCETNFDCMLARLHGHSLTRPILLPEVYHGHTAIVVCLLDKGANALVRDPDGSTALMWAAQQGHTDLVRLLLTRGTPLEARDAEGNTALFRSIWSGNPATVAALLRAGANVRATNRRGQTVLYLARQSRQDRMARLLQQAGAKD